MVHINIHRFLHLIPVWVTSLSFFCTPKSCKYKALITGLASWKVPGGLSIFITSKVAQFIYPMVGISLNTKRAGLQEQFHCFSVSLWPVMKLSSLLKRRVHDVLCPQPWVGNCTHNLEIALVTLAALIFHGTLPLGAVCVGGDFGLEEHRHRLATDVP